MISGAAGMLIPLAGARDPGDDPLVSDVALHEPGEPADYRGTIVLVNSRIDDRFVLGSLLDEVGTAGAVVLPPGATTDLSLVRGHTARLFRRSPWVGWSELFRVLVRLLGGPGRFLRLRCGACAEPRRNRPRSSLRGAA